LLRERGTLLASGIDVKRVVFSRDHKGAVQEAFQSPPRRSINELVEAYLAAARWIYLVASNCLRFSLAQTPRSRRSERRVQSLNAARNESGSRRVKDESNLQGAGY